MSACPIESSPEWKALLKQAGSYPAAYIKYVNNNYTIPLLNTPLELEAYGKIGTEVTPSIEKDLEFLEMRARIVESLATRIDTAVRRQQGEVTQTAKESIKKIQAIYDDIQKADNILKFDNFATNAIGNLESLNKRLTKAVVRDMPEGLTTAEKKEWREQAKKDGTFRLYELNNLNDFALGYDITGDMLSYVASLTGSTPEEEAAYSKLKAQLTKAQGLMVAINTEYQAAVMNSLVETLANMSTKVRDTYRMSYEAEYKKGSYETAKKDPVAFKLAMDKHVNNLLDVNSAKIHKEEKDHIRGLLKFSPTDISKLVAFLGDARSTNDHLIQLASKVLDRTEQSVNEEFIEKKNKFIDIWEVWDKANPAGTAIKNNRERYSKFIRKDKNGNITNQLLRSRTDEFYDDMLSKKESVKKLKDELDEVKRTTANKALHKQVQDKIDTIVGTFNNKWMVQKYDENGIPVIDNYNRPVLEPGPQSLNPLIEKLSKEDRVMFEAFKDMVEESNFLTGTNSGSASKRTLPSIRGDVTDRMLAGQSAKDIAINSIKDSWIIQGDELSEQYVSQDVNGNTINYIKKFNRYDLDIQEQSFDLPAILLSDNYMALAYASKRKIEPTLSILNSFMQSRDVGIVTGSGKSQRKNKHGATPVILDADGKPVTTSTDAKLDGISNSEKRLQDLLRDRLYATPVVHTTLGGVSINKVTENLISFSAKTMLRFNWDGGLTNLVQGVTNNILGGFAGKYYNSASLAKAQMDYWKDLSGIMNDIGATRAKSPTNMLMEYLGLNIDLSSVSEAFKRDMLHANIDYGKVADSFYGGPEHYISSSLMYAVLDSMKVKNDKGEYINKDGVCSKEEAWSIKEAILKFENGIPQFDPRVASVNNHAVNGKNMKETMLNIGSFAKSALEGMQGAYSAQNKSAIQREWYGKAFMFMRNWIFKGFQARVGGHEAVFQKDLIGKQYHEIDLHFRHYEQSSFSYIEGSYITAIRMMQQVKKEAGWVQAALMFLPGTSGNKTFKNKYHDMSEMEQQNLKKVALEIATMMGYALVAATLTSLAMAGPGDDDDDNKLLGTLAYVAARNSSDLMFYTGLSVNDNLRVLDTPTYLTKTMKDGASLVGAAKNSIGHFIGLVPEEKTVYRSGDHKGESKFKVKSLKLLFPLYAHIFNSNIMDKNEYINK